MSASVLQPIINLLTQSVVDVSSSVADLSSSVADLSSYTYQTNNTFASVSSNITQLQLGASTPKSISFDTIEINSGFSFDLATFPTRIPIPTTGVYKFSWSIQFDKAGGVSVWWIFGFALMEMMLPVQEDKSLWLGQMEKHYQ